MGLDVPHCPDSIRPESLTSAALSLLTTPVVAQSLSLEGPAGAKVELAAADVGALPRVKFVFDAHGDKPAAQPHKH